MTFTGANSWPGMKAEPKFLKNFIDLSHIQSSSSVYHNQMFDSKDIVSAQRNANRQNVEAVRKT